MSSNRQGLGVTAAAAAGLLIGFSTAHAAFVTIAPGGPSGLSAEIVYFVPPPGVAPIATGPGPAPLLFPPPPGNPPAPPGVYIVDALASGADAGDNYHYSVGLGAIGLPASPIAFEVLFGTAPSQIFPGPPIGPLPPEAAGDVFTALGPITGVLGASVPYVPGPGEIGDEFMMGLNVGDDLGGLSYRPAVAGFYSLAAGGLGFGPFGAADIISIATGLLYAPAGALGLLPGDDIDALAIQDLGVPGMYDPLDAVLYSLTPGSPTLVLFGFTPGDVLTSIGGIPILFLPGVALGLLPGDNLDALDITFAPPDADGDGVGDGVDNCPTVANTDQADGDGDLRGNMCDNCSTLANNTGAGAQADSDSDSFGNRCDGDLNNNSTTNAQDYVLFRLQLGEPSVAPVYNEADINANGAVNAQDYVLFRGLLGSPAGPGAGP